MILGDFLGLMAILGVIFLIVSRLLKQIQVLSFGTFGIFWLVLEYFRGISIAPQRVFGALGTGLLHRFFFLGLGVVPATGVT